MVVAMTFSVPFLGIAPSTGLLNEEHPPLILEEKSDGASAGQPGQLMERGMYVKCKASVYVQSNWSW